MKSLKASKREPERGASPRQPVRQPRSWAMPWRALARVGALALAVVALAQGYRAVQLLLDRPVSRVAISGEFRYVQREALERRLQPYIQRGFATIDLQRIRAELEAQPWIASATVQRRWPDYLQIAIREQEPIARWGDTGFLNYRGELFRPEQAVDIPGLPLLDGPDSEALLVMTHFRDLSELLRTEGLLLQRLRLDAQQSWRAELVGGVELVLGSSQVMDRLQRFLQVYRADLARQFERVARIDMRYSNGLAVAWRISGQNS